jgi:type I restriction enzyme, S subunit
MTELPKGWTSATIADVTEDILNVHPDQYPNSEFGYVDISSINNSNYTIANIRKIKGTDAPSRARRPVQAGDVLFSNVRTYLRNIAMVPEGSEAQICSTGFTVLRANAAVDPMYLFRWVLTDSFIEGVTPRQTGTHYPATSDRVVRSEAILLPPLQEQRRIVAKLEKLLSRVDAAQMRLAAVPLTFKRFRQSVLAAACSGRLTADWRQTERVSDYYEPRTIEDVADYVGGFAYRSTTFTESGSNQVVRIGNVRPFSLQLEASPVFIPDEIAKTTERFRLAPDDIVISMTGTKYKRDYGYAAIVTRTKSDLFINQRVSRLRCNSKVLSPFLLYWLQTDTFKDFFFEGETGNVNQGNVGADGIRKAPIELPSLPEQQEIVRRVEALFQTADALEARYRTAKMHVDKLSQSILARAFRGELVPQDSNDEPASNLMERITTERALEHNATKQPKRTTSKPKRTEVTMLKPEEIQHSQLSDILKDRGPLTPEMLWKESQLDIDDFYGQLKLEETRGLLWETSKDASKTVRLLEAA